jgi:hypothetical protein
VTLCGAETQSGRPCRRTAGRCPSHPAEDVGEAEAGEGGRIRRQVEEALVGVASDWRTELARSLADALDAQPQAAMARELRALMATIDPAAPATSAKREGSKVDELAARRAERLAGTGGT